MLFRSTLVSTTTLVVGRFLAPSKEVYDGFELVSTLDMYKKNDEVLVWSNSQKDWVEAFLLDVATVEGQNLTDDVTGNTYACRPGTLLVKYLESGSAKFFTPQDGTWKTDLARRLPAKDDDEVAWRAIEKHPSDDVKWLAEGIDDSINNLFIPNCLEGPESNHCHKYGQQLLDLKLPEGSKIQKQARTFMSIFDLFFEIDPVVKKGFVMAPYFDEVEFEAMLRKVLNNSNDLSRSEIVRKSLMRSYNAELPITAGGSFVDDEKLRERFGPGVNWVVFRDRKKSIRDVLEKVLVPGSEKKATEPDETSTDEGSDPEPVAEDPKFDAITTDFREKLAVSPEPKATHKLNSQITDAEKKRLKWFLAFAEGCTLTQVSMFASFNENEAAERAKTIYDLEPDASDDLLREYCHSKGSDQEPAEVEDCIKTVSGKLEQLNLAFDLWSGTFVGLLENAIDAKTAETFETARGKLVKEMNETLAPGAHETNEEKEVQQLIARNLWIEAKARAQGSDRCSVNPTDATNPNRVALQKVIEQFLEDNF